MPDPTSRYAALEIATMAASDGAGGSRQVRYLRRRFPPQPDSLTAMAAHVVVRGDRLDLVAAVQLGDPTQFWRLCDANAVIHPDELTAEDRIGRTVRIPAPGIVR
jgi:hypothetical protein